MGLLIAGGSNRPVLALGCYASSCNGKDAGAMKCLDDEYLLSQVYIPANPQQGTGPFHFNQWYSGNCAAGWGDLYNDGTCGLTPCQQSMLLRTHGYRNSSCSGADSIHYDVW